MVKAIQIELQTLATDISRSTVSDSEAQFKKVFTSSFNKLKHYAFTIVRDDVTAEEMVQNVFYVVDVYLLVIITLVKIFWILTIVVLKPLLDQR